MAKQLVQAQEILDQKFAPWVRELDLKIERMDQDGVVMRMPHHLRTYRAGGIVCGQSLMALADTAMVFVFAAARGDYVSMTTVSQTTNFMKPIADADVVARCRALRIGRTLGFGEALLYAGDAEEPAVQVASTYAFLKPR